LVLLFSLVLVLFYNLPTWKTLGSLVTLQGNMRLGFEISFALLLWATFTLLLTLISFRPLLKPALTIIALASAGAAYFMNNYGIAIDTAMLQNVLEATSGEARALLSPKLFGYLLVLGVLPSVLIWCLPVTYERFISGLFYKLQVIIGCLLVIAASVGVFYPTYAPLLQEQEKLTTLITPTNYLYAAGKLTLSHLSINRMMIQATGEDAAMSAEAKDRRKKTLMIFVVGESARADHFLLNGYARDTNPELAKLDVLDFTQVHACGTSTAVSVPCMFSRFPRSDYSDKQGKTNEGLLDILQRAGVQVLWLDNNGGCKGTCLRVPHRDVVKDQPSPFCDAGNCLDEALLVGLRESIDNLTGNAIIVLHAKGSQGPRYDERYPKNMEAFQPACQTNQLGNCTRDELLNAYDNSLLYTDHFLSRVVSLLKTNQERFDTAMLYVSDHGESLGENGLYLNAAPYTLAPEAQTHVPMLMWFGQNALSDLGLDRRCLQGKRDEQDLSHDYLFHSLLGLFQVRTGVYQPGLDVFHDCRRVGP
jgi:lipid A ethanolaminephosphotransferase